MNGYLSVRNWNRYQHYSGRKPVWIKLYAHMQDDRDWFSLSIALRVFWIEALMLAARYENAIPNDPKRLSVEMNLPIRTVREGIEKLLEMRWLSETKTSRRASKPLAKRTGWKFVRGTHSGTYVPDPNGKDIPPYAARSETLRKDAA